MLEYIRVATAVPAVQVGDVGKNTEDICEKIRLADEAGTDLLVFPELALTGYTCADLFFQNTLQVRCMKGLERILTCSTDHPCVTAVVGTPVILEGQMYNCGAVISGGKLRGLVPKTYLPNYNEFSERRWFSSSMDLKLTQVSLCDLGMAGNDLIPVGRDLLFRIGDGCVLGVEICEDLWTPLPPSTLLSINGAEVIVNLSASNETVGKRGVRNSLVSHQSDICNCIYAYCSSGYTESTQDLVFSGHSIISECGTKLGENKKLMDTDYLLIRDADFGKVRSARRKNKSVRDAASFYGNLEPMRTIDCCCQPLRSDGSLYPLDKRPFIPSGEGERLQRCMSIFEIQVAGLKRRLSLLQSKAVVGLTGGLDSTLALLVAVEAMRQLGRTTSDVHAVIVSDREQPGQRIANAQRLISGLGVTAKTVDIRQSVLTHFQQIGLTAGPDSATARDAVARERTQVLMDYAASVNAVMVGSGDLSELALGQCTYNGDQMSMYGVNASVPKTLAAWMVESLSESPMFAPVARVLVEVVQTQLQLAPTEEEVGPYVLHDFFLYHMARHAFSPRKIYTLACRAFADEFDGETIQKWMSVFYRRFFTQQFKRNCMPEGVKIGSISLSPRGDWRMPSDASAKIWLDEVEKL